MDKKYNVQGIVDRPNTELIKKIMELKAKGVYFKDIAKIVNRSERRVKDLYYREAKKLSTEGSLDTK